jgi:hypothetical protein
MDERNQFTFYRSFWEAVKGLPKKDRLPILESIIEYALDGKSPSGLSQSQSAFFLLVKPNLDASRKKAANGKQGGSKSKAKSKQTETKKENEEENENEIEIEGEKEKKQTALVLDTLFESFWSAYPNQIARDAAKEAWDELKLSVEDAQRIIASVATWRKSEAWSEKGGKFIPRAAKFLADGYWKSPPASADKKIGLGTAELAAIQRLMQGEEEA